MYGHTRPAKIRISLCIHTVWSESSLDILLISIDANFLHAGNRGSEQIGQIESLIALIYKCRL